MEKQVRLKHPRDRRRRYRQLNKFFNAMAKPFRSDPDKIGDNGLTRLQQAIRDNDLSRAASLIKAGANINFAGNMIYPPLHFCLDKARTNIALLLLQAGADVNLQDTHGRTPLHRAAEHCHESFVFALLKAGADPNIPDRDGKTALHVLSTAKPELIDVLVKHNANINAADKNGNTPLHTFLDKPVMVERLLMNGADPNQRNIIGYSPYMLMLDEKRFQQYHKVLQHMLAHKADLGSTNELGETILHLAARLDMTDTFNKALSSAELTVKDCNGNNVLHALVRTNNVFMLARVLDRAPELLHERNFFGETPLADLAGRADQIPFRMTDKMIATARIMIIRGADPSVRDSSTGRTLLHHAVEQDKHEFIEVLIKHKINLDIIDKSGKSALHIAIERKNMELLDRLLDAGANPDLTDAKGWTLLDRLAEKQDRDSPVVQRLIVAGGQYNKQLPLHPELMRKNKPSLDKGHLDKRDLDKGSIDKGITKPAPRFKP